MENIIKDCFPPDGTQKVWTEDGKIYVAITEDHNWSQNKCVLRDWFFDYAKFKKTGYQIDCQSYGVYVFWPRAEPQEEEFCEEHEQVMWKDGLKCGGCLAISADPQEKPQSRKTP